MRAADCPSNTVADATKTSPKRPRTPTAALNIPTQHDTPGRIKNRRLTKIILDLNQQFGWDFSVGPIPSGQSKPSSYPCREQLCRQFWKSEVTLNHLLDKFRSSHREDHTVEKLHSYLTTLNSSQTENEGAERPLVQPHRGPHGFAKGNGFKDRVTSFESNAPSSIFSSQEMSSQESANTSAMTSFTHSVQSTEDASHIKPERDEIVAFGHTSTMVTDGDFEIGSSYSPSPPASPSPRPRKHLKIGEGTNFSPPSPLCIEKGLIGQRSCVAGRSLLHEDLQPYFARQTTMQLSKEPVEHFQSRNIPSAGFFCQRLTDESGDTPLRSRYDSLRYATHYGVSLPNVSAVQIPVREERELFHQHLLCLTRDLSNHKGLPDPERTSKNAWAHAQDKSWAPEVSMSGSLEPQSSKSEAAFRLHVNPLSYEDKSNRFFRQFGAHRFFKLMVPVAGKSSKHLNSAVVESRLQQWLNVPGKLLLGCEWNALFIKPQRATKKAKRRFAKDDRREVMFFATSGPGLVTISRADVVNWFLPTVGNLNMPACKTFARLELGFSTTWATVTFQPSQIKENCDRLGDGAAEDLSLNDQSLDWTGVYDPETPRVMDDGCSTMSHAAAVQIWESLGKTGPIPSAFQARIGPWKGVWSVEPLKLHDPGDDRDDVWIKTTSSQRKWCRAAVDYDRSTFDPLRLTFEVLTWTHKLASSRIYHDHLPILQHRGVSVQAFEGAVLTRLGLEEEEAISAWCGPVECGRWLQAKKPLVKAIPDATDTQGSGRKTADIASTLLRSGFELSTCSYLAEQVVTIQTWHFTDISNDLHIDIAESTTVIGIADPTGTLGPSEIHLCFSHPVGDAPFLDGVDALISRHPSLRASDMQRVHTILKPELKHLRDVVVFPVTGSYPLAGKLQGGDYDGDTFWICWDRKIVQSFRNAPPPATAPRPGRYGIEVDRTTYGDLMATHNGVDRFFQLGFAKQWQQSLLGQCTNYHEELRYRLPLDHRCVNEIADIHDLIIDSSKNGYTYTSDTWSRQRNLPHYPRGLVKLLYKEAAETELSYNTQVSDSGNIIDYLVFKVARARSRQIVSGIKHRAPSSSARDLSIQDLYTDTAAEFQFHRCIQDTFAALRKALKEQVHPFWTKTGRVVKSRSGRGPGQWTKEEINAYRSLRGAECTQLYQALEPDDEIVKVDPTVKAWLTHAGKYGFRHWDLLKASFLYHEYNGTPRFPFEMALKELCELRAQSIPGSEPVVALYRAQSKLRKRNYAAYSSSNYGSASRNGAASSPREIDEDGDDMDIDDAPLQRLANAQAQARQAEPRPAVVDSDMRSISPPALKRQQRHRIEEARTCSFHEAATTTATLDAAEDVDRCENRSSTDSDQIFIDLSQGWSQLGLQGNGLSKWSMPDERAPYV